MPLSPPNWISDRWHHINITWNFSSSEVTRLWACARGVWHRSMHWCTWDMESVGRSQQSALHLNMRPCSGITCTPFIKQEMHRSCWMHLICIDIKTPTCILRMCSFSRLWTISSTTFCTRVWWASAIFSRS